MEFTQRLFKSIFSILATLHFSASAQVMPNDSTTPKVIKNHFYPQYPEDVVFIQCGLQDKAGNMWFGSAGDGVYRYDGKSFTNYTTRNGMCHNDVICILEDNAGNIWFGTRGGVCRYTSSITNKGQSKISMFPLISKSSYVGGNFVWSIFQDKKGKIWFGTTEGVYIYEPGSGSSEMNPVITKFPNNSVVNKNELQLKMVQEIIEDRSGNIWFASGDFSGEGICLYDGKALTNFKPDSIASFNSILKTKTGELFFTSLNKGIYKLAANFVPKNAADFTNYTKSIGLGDLIFTAMLEDKNGNFWFGAYSENREEKQLTAVGAWLYDGKALKNFTTENGLSNNDVNCIVEDREGNIWFGTRTTGLCRYDGKNFVDFTD